MNILVMAYIMLLGIATVGVVAFVMEKFAEKDKYKDC